MELASIDVIESRHSVRAYKEQPIPEDIREGLENIIARCNSEGGLSIRPVYDEPNAFSKSKLAHYGNFRNANNYLVMAAPKGTGDKRQTIGYYGETLVLWLKAHGIDSCWVGLSYSGRHLPFKLGKDEKLHLLISIGYGDDPGRKHKVKTPEQVCRNYSAMPDWVKRGVMSALLAPTAVNQQKFKFEMLDDGRIKATSGLGFYAKVDLGIVRYHFECGAAPHKVEWA